MRPNPRSKSFLIFLLTHTFFYFFCQPSLKNFFFFRKNLYGEGNQLDDFLRHYDFFEVVYERWYFFFSPCFTIWVEQTISLRVTRCNVVFFFFFYFFNFQLGRSIDFVKSINSIIFFHGNVCLLTICKQEIWELVSRLCKILISTQMNFWIVDWYLIIHWTLRPK